MVNGGVRRTDRVDMFPRLAALAACSFLFLLGVVPTGAVYVTTLPAGADVWLDGTYIGHSPVIVDALSSGRHAVSLSRTGWISQDINVSVVAGTTALSSIALLRSSAQGMRGTDGQIAVKGLAARSLLLDGALLVPDKTGTITVATGLHQLVAQTPSGKMTRSITVYPDMRTDIVLRSDETAEHSAVVAPASDYLPKTALKIEGAHLTIKYARHEVDATLGAMAYRYDGRSVNYDAAPTLIGAALYLPLELLEQLTADPKAK